MGLFEDIIEEKRKIKIGNQDVVLDPSLMVFTEANLSNFQEKSAIYIEYFGQCLADADAEERYHDMRLEAVYAQKFVTFKEEGGSDKLCEAKVQADPDYLKVRDNAWVARHKVRLLQNYLKAWDKAHENAQNRSHTLRKEMDKFTPKTFESAHDDDSAKLEDIMGK